MPNEWPDYCCVPALVELALREFNCDPPQRSDLARSIGVEAPLEASNPLHLMPADVGDVGGVSIHHALHTIPQLLQSLDCPATFTHRPFSDISSQDYSGEYESMRARRCFVGVGVNWPTLIGVDARSKHVMVLLAYGEQTVTVYDAVYPDRGRQNFSTSVFELAVTSVPDGFWVFEPSTGRTR